MKNKRLMVTLGILILGMIGFQSVTKKETSKSNQVPKVGVLQFVTHDALDEIYRGIKVGLKSEGYSDNQVVIDFLNAEGDQSKVQTMSQTLVNHGNQILVGIATPAAQGLASATKEVPIVMGAVTDPVGAKLVKNLEKPGGNITGVSDKTPMKAQLKLIKELTPSIKTIGILYSSSEDNSKSQVDEFNKLAESMGYQTVVKSVPSTNEIKTTTEVLLSQVDALWIPLDNTVASAFSTVVQAAKENQKPIYPSVDTMVSEGGLASVVINQYELGVETGKMAAKILHGESISEMSVTIFDQGKPIVNKAVAKELGIIIPSHIKSQR